MFVYSSTTWFPKIVHLSTFGLSLQMHSFAPNFLNHAVPGVFGQRHTRRFEGLFEGSRSCRQRHAARRAFCQTQVSSTGKNVSAETVKFKARKIAQDNSYLFGKLLQDVLCLMQVINKMMYALLPWSHVAS